jgi:hypothetical protein
MSVPANVIGGFGGSVSFISGAACDFNKFSLRISQDVGDCTAYDTVAASNHRGSGTLDYSLSCGGTLIKTAPGFNSNVFTAEGGACTLTSASGCTHAGNFVLSGGSIEHGRRNPTQAVSYDGVNAGAVTETWATS